MYGSSVAPLLAAIDGPDGDPIVGSKEHSQTVFDDKILRLAAKAEDVLLIPRYKKDLELFFCHMFTVTDNARTEEDNTLDAVESWLDAELSSSTLQFQFVL